MENQYPDESKREEIANACNSVIQKPGTDNTNTVPLTADLWLGLKCYSACTPPGCKISEFERVTALKVYNWFANRRKEMKRRANIGKDLIHSFYVHLTCIYKKKGFGWTVITHRIT